MENIKLTFAVIGNKSQTIEFNSVNNISVEVKPVANKSVMFNELTINSDCDVNSHETLEAIINKDGWLSWDSEELPPMRGFFSEITFEPTFVNGLLTAEFIFIGGFNYIQEQMEIAQVKEQRHDGIKFYKESKQKKNLKRKITFN